MSPPVMSTSLIRALLFSGGVYIALLLACTDAFVVHKCVVFNG